MLFHYKVLMNHIRGVGVGEIRDGRSSMEPMRENPGLPAKQQLSRDWARLIRKLRWIGLDSEARRLEQVLSTLPRAG